MPSLLQLLEDSMPFTGARGDSATLLELPAEGDFRAPRPQAVGDRAIATDDPDEILVKRIWQFDQDAGSPATFRDLRIWSRGMGMGYRSTASVAKKVVFDDLLVKRLDGTDLELPLTQDFVAGRWWIGMGEIPEMPSGLWQLESKLDVSLLVAFAYEEVDGAVIPISRADIDAMGESFMPRARLMPACLDFIAVDDASARICVGNSRYVALVSLTTCRERPDFAPGELVGFGRFYPHVMVMGTADAKRVEVSIRIERPASAMTHGDPEMQHEIKSLLVADANRNHSETAFVVPDLPVPVTSNIYDYYVTDAHEYLRARQPVRLSSEERAALPRGRWIYHEDAETQRPGEVTLADARFESARRLEPCVRRLGGDAEPIRKTARQGQFDNLHIAPRMRFEFDHVAIDRPLQKLEFRDVVMVFVCMHDCIHMHVRWAAFSSVKPTLGFSEGRPYSKAGAPAVPENQTVFASFPSDHALVYRAVADGCTAGEWQVFCHHGAGYAIAEWPHPMSRAMLTLLSTAVHVLADAPFPIFPSMPLSWPAFYWRCRWTGDPSGRDIPMERLDFNLERCLR